LLVLQIGQLTIGQLGIRYFQIFEFGQLSTAQIQGYDNSPQIASFFEDFDRKNPAAWAVLSANQRLSAQ